MNDKRSAQQRLSLVQRLRAYIPVEGQEGIAVRDALMREAADEIERLKRQESSMAREISDAARGAAEEATWRAIQGEEYGSY